MPIRIPVVQTGLEASIQQAAQRAGRNMKINLGASAKSVDALSQPLGRITGQADEFTKSMGAANARVLAFGASVGIIAAVSKGFSNLVRTTIEVEKSLASINSILNQSASELSNFKGEIFQIARETEQTFSVVADAALELSRQGLKAEEVSKRLKDSLVLARLTGLDTADAVSGLTAAINSFNSAGLSSSQVLNKVSAAAVSAAVSERDLIEAIKRSGSVAVTTGVQFDELIGIVSALQEKTSRGGAVIGNSLKTIFTRIQSADSISSLRDLGVQVTDLNGEILSSDKLIKNLAGEFSKLGKNQQINLADSLVGKFQIAPFLALIQDYNKEVSRTSEVAAKSLNATNEAYKRNEALNLTLSAVINKVTVSAKELANALGEIGVTDSLKNIISFFDGVFTKIRDLVQGEGTGSEIAKGILKGISKVISGPGLAIFGAIIAKLALDLTKFGLASLKTFFGLNSAAKEQARLQGQIASTLLNNSAIQKQILNIEQMALSVEEKRRLQAKFFTDALNSQLALMRQMQGISASIVPAVMTGTRAARSGKAAGGFLPVAAEKSDISKGVGGAPQTAKPVVIPNFSFGSGQRGTMVANSSEYIVPNFRGSGGDAIFNQEMVKSMGLPSGARKINASAGFIPNFTAGQIEKKGIGGLQGKSLKYNFEKYVVNNEADQNSEIKKAPYVLMGRLFESIAQGSNIINLQENSTGPDIKNGPYKIAEAKLSGKAAYNDSNFGEGKSKENVLLLPTSATKVYDKLLTKNKNAVIIRSGEIYNGESGPTVNHRQLFKSSEAIINYYKETPRSQIPKFIDISKFRNAAGGFIPNFAQTIDQRFAGAQGSNAKMGSLFRDVLGTPNEALFAQRFPSEYKSRKAALQAGGFASQVAIKDARQQKQLLLDSLPLINASKQYGLVTGINNPNYAEKLLYASKVGRVSETPTADSSYRVLVPHTGVRGKELTSAYFRKLERTGSLKGRISSAENILGKKLSLSETKNFIKGQNKGAMEAKIGSDVENQLRFLAGIAIQPSGQRIDLPLTPELKKYVGALPSSVKAVEIKSSLSSGNLLSMGQKLLASDPKALDSKLSKSFKGKAAGGFIPSFAAGGNYVFDSDTLPNELKKQALSAILASKKKKDVLLAPAGAGKSTYAQKLGQLIRNMDDVKKASSFTLLSGASKAKSGGFSKPLQEILSNAKASGGRLSYLHVPNLEIKNRRSLRTAGEGDLRSAAQLKGTRYAPLNQYDFVQQLKKEFGQDFNLIRGAEGYIPNFASENALNSLRLRAAYKGNDPGLINEAKVAKTKLEKIGSSKGVSLRELFDKEASFGLTQMVNAAYQQSSATASKDQVYKVFEGIAKKEPTLSKLREFVKKRGFVPNFADPLKDAINREMGAGLPASQVYVDQNPRLKSPQNPMGLMVANRRDEPSGGFQGINRAVREGRNPKTYGAAGGFIPNYAVENNKDNVNITKKALSDLNEEIKKLSESVKNNNKTFDEAENELKNFISTIEKGKGGKISNKMVASVEKASINELRDQVNSTDDSDEPVQKANRDLLGTVFALQAGLSFLTGATEGSANKLAQIGNAASSIASAGSSAMLATEGLKGLFKEGSGAANALSKLGPYAAIAGAAYQGWKMLSTHIDKNNASIGKASEAMDRVAEAASKAAVNFNTLKPAQQEKIKEQREFIIEKAKSNAENAAFESSNRYSGTPSWGASYSSLTAIQRVKFEGVSDTLQNQFNSLIDQALGVGVGGGKIREKVQTAMDSGLIVTAKEVEEISGELETMINMIGSANSLIKEFKLAPDSEAGIELLNIKTEDLVAELNKAYKKVDLGYHEINGDPFIKYRQYLEKIGVTEVDRQNDYIREAKNQLEQLVNSENQASEDRLKNADLELKKTIQNIIIEKNIRKQLESQEDKMSDKRLSSEEALAAIKNNIFLSDYRRDQLSAKEELRSRREIINLEAQSKILEDILSKSKEMAELTPLKGRPKMQKLAQEDFKRILSDPDQSAKLSNLTLGDIETADGDQTMSILEKLGFQQKLLELLKTDEMARKGILKLLISSVSLKEKEEDLAKRLTTEEERRAKLAANVLKINENNSRVIARAQNLVGARADKYSMEADKIGRQDSILDAQKNLALLKLEVSTKETDPFKKIEEQKRINDYFFERQLQNEQAKAKLEAKANFIRNMKVDENIRALDDNTKSQDEFTDKFSQLLTNPVVAPQFLAPNTSSLSDTKLKLLSSFDAEHMRKLLGAEAGDGGADAQAQILGQIINRANMRGVSIDTVAKDRRYWEVMQNGTINTRKPLTEEELKGVLQNSNLNTPYYHNVSNNEKGRNILKNEGIDLPKAFEEGWARIVGKDIMYIKPEERLFKDSRKAFSATVLSASEQQEKAEELAGQNLTPEQMYEQALVFTTKRGLAENADSAAEAIKLYAMELKSIGSNGQVKMQLKEITDESEALTASMTYGRSAMAKSNQELKNAIGEFNAAPSTFSEGMENAFLQMKIDNLNFASSLGRDIPKMFSDGMSNAMMSVLEGTVTLKDALRSAAYEFLKTINQRLFSNIADSFTSGFMPSLFQKRASGGLITGGSGSKDDVPALLMGGEYVVKKDAVNKYGRGFFEQLNSGAVPQFANGGYFAPGFYDQGAIKGKQNLLNFATQSYTTGQNDVMNFSNGASILSLEPESVNLTNKGRKMGTPMQNATIDAKNQAFDLYAQQIKAEQEAKKQAKEQKKQLMDMLKMSAISLVAGSVLKAGLSGAQTGIADAKLAKGGPLGFLGTLGAAGSGAGKGLGNFFGGIGDVFTGNFGMNSNGGSPQGFKRISTAMNQGYIGMGSFTSNVSKRATGGQLPDSSGVDTIPAMLSGGEFVMNNAATKNIGTGNLNALNSGASSLVTEEKSEQLNQKIIDKLDELIEASLKTGEINITVNNGKTEGDNQDQSSENGGQNMARKIRDAVLRVIEEEKRLGGTLRRGLA
jgi:TP901 family phage tail tape measure protein